MKLRTNIPKAENLNNESFEIYKSLIDKHNDHKMKNRIKQLEEKNQVLFQRLTKIDDVILDLVNILKYSCQLKGLSHLLEI